MIKRRFIALLLTTILCTSSVFATTISIDNTQTIEDSTYVPLRSLAEQLEATVGYNNGIAVVYKDGIVYAIDMANKTLVKSNLKTGEKTTEDVLLENIENSLYLPLETFANIFNVGTSYNSETASIEISKDNKDAYSNNLRNSIKELDDLIAKTTDDSELTKLKEKRSLLYRSYLEYSGFVQFTGEYTTDEKKKLIADVVEEIRVMTGSSLPTTRSARTSPDDITGIGTVPKLIAIYSVKGYDKQTGTTAYIVGGRYMPIGRYYGGSVDFGIYADGMPVMVTGHNFALDTDQYIGKVLGLGNTSITQPILDDRGINIDVDSITLIQFKTNIFGDFDIIYDENGEFVYGDPSYFEDAKKGFKGFINFDPPEQTTGSAFKLDL